MTTVTFKLDENAQAEDTPLGDHPKVADGVYRVLITGAEAGESQSKGTPMITIKTTITGDAAGGETDYHGWSKNAYIVFPKGDSNFIASLNRANYMTLKELCGDEYFEAQVVQKDDNNNVSLNLEAAARKILSQFSLEELLITVKNKLDKKTGTIRDNVEKVEKIPVTSDLVSEKPVTKDAGF